MTFEEVLDQAIAMLQRKGRVSYRALKAQFQLDDDLLALLKDEIIEVHQLASDQDGTMLVWRGETLTTPAPALQAPTHDISPPPTTSRPTEAERRQLTVEFCDLVGSTALSGQLDPEDLREVVHAYQEAAAEVIHRYEGHIAQYLGDGLLIYSGYPQAHEDDAYRAIRIGLDIVAAIASLNSRLEQQYGVRLAVRVGIHTGPVVVGEMGGGGRHEQLALGETPNIAARLEGLAVSNQVVISDATRRLVGGAFDLEDLGAHTLKGIAEPMPVYGVRGEREVASRFEAATVTGLTPLVGREEEIGLVLRRWDQATEGDGQVVLLCGEPGIGKSRLTQTVRERIAEDGHFHLHYQCSPYYVNSAFYPIITQLERAAQFARSDKADEKLDKLEALLGQGTEQVAEVAPLFAALFAIPPGDRYPPLSLTPQRQKEHTIAALVDQFVGLPHRQPVLFIFEDAHWSDPTSLEVLDLLMHRVPDVRALVVITYRPEFAPPWGGVAHVTTHTLNRLTRRQVVTLVARVTGGKTLPDVVLDQIAAKTDGVPLFVEELTKTVLEAGFLHDRGDRYDLTGPLPPLAIPATLQDALMARLDRLAPVKEVAQIGAALGREFAYELIAALSPLQGPTLQDALDQLVSAELLFRRGTPLAVTYLFKHALVQDTAYGSLLKSRRQQLHTRIAQVLEAQFPETVAAEPELVAHHYTEAGLTEEAIPYWQQAGESAMQRSANVEAISHFTHGLALLQALPDASQRPQQELMLQLALGAPLMATMSWASPDVERVYTRARQLCQQLGDTPQLFPVLHGLWIFYSVRGEIQTAYELAEQLLGLAQSQQDPDLLLEAYVAMGAALSCLGDFVSAREHFTQVVSLYNLQQHHTHGVQYGQDPLVFCLSYDAFALWSLGYPDQAEQRMQESRTAAQAVSHLLSVVWASQTMAILSQLRGEAQTTQAWAETVMTLCQEHGLAYFLAFGTSVHGWALATQGEVGIPQIREGLASYKATGSVLWQGYQLALLADACRQSNQADQGLAVVAEALSLMHDTKDQKWYEAELHRQKGELLLLHTANNHTAVETCFHHALDIARHQQAKSWELRAATSLARLWQQQGKSGEARALLAPVYSWFTEGFDTADLQEAKALLEELET